MKKKVEYNKIYLSIFILLSICGIKNVYSFQLDIDIDKKTAQEIVKSIPSLPEGSDSRQMVLEGNQIDGQDSSFLKASGSKENPSQIWQQDKYIQAEEIYYDFVKDTASAKDNVILKNEEIILSAPKANYTFDEQSGEVENAKYRFIKKDGYGKADKANLEKYNINLKNGTYTTCEPDSTDWYIKANELNIDERSNIATARDAKLVFLGLPLFASPYVSFSLNNQKRSGFLVPTFSINSRAGADVTIPYYFNIAPQHDATIYPRIVSKRGFLFGAEFRYLREKYSGRLEGEFLPNDAQTKNNRWALSLEHKHNITNWLNGYINFEKVSDKNYPDDFGKSLSEYSKHLYTQEFGLKSHIADDKQSLDGLIRYRKYQSLTDIPPYNLSPQANVVYNYKLPANFELNSETDATYFTHPSKIDGKRIFNDINISASFDDVSYFVRPNLRLHTVNYWLDNDSSISDGKTKSNIIPTFSLDSSLFFERKLKLFEGKQTLEPRLFYVYTPYKNQDDLPLFDTTEPEFGLNALFSNNRFIGHDRISDANQLTAGITSRWLNNNGVEKTWLTIGQRYQFENTKVNLDNKTLNGLKGLSDLIVQGAWNFNQNFSTYGDIQFNPHDKKLTKLSTQIDWMPSSNQSLGVGYKYRQKTDATNNTPFKQINFNSKWQLHTNWKVNSKISYDLQGKALSNAFLGIDYLHNCWQMRTGIDRVVGADGKYTTRGIFQIALKGLGNALD